MAPSTGDWPDSEEWEGQVTQWCLEQRDPAIAFAMWLCEAARRKRMTPLVEAAKILKVPYPTLRNQVNRGCLDAREGMVPTVNGMHRVKLVDIRQARAYNQLDARGKVEWRKNRIQQRAPTGEEDG